MRNRSFALAAAMLLITRNFAVAGITIDRKTLDLDAGAAQPLHAQGAAAGDLRWTSSDPAIAAVYRNGYVVALRPGSAKISVAAAASSAEAPQQCAVTVTEPRAPLVNPATLKQYPDSRRFEVDGRKCYGSELNGQRADDPDEHRNLESNRVINPQPLNGNDKL